MTEVKASIAEVKEEIKQEEMEPEEETAKEEPEEEAEEEALRGVEAKEEARRCIVTCFHAVSYRDAFPRGLVSRRIFTRSCIATHF